MFYGLNAAFKKIAFLDRTFFLCLEKDGSLMERDQVNKTDAYSHGHDTLVNRGIVLVKQHTFTEFSATLEFNIFS